MCLFTQLFIFSDILHNEKETKVRGSSRILTFRWMLVSFFLFFVLLLCFFSVKTNLPINSFHYLFTSPVAVLPLRKWRIAVIHHPLVGWIPVYILRYGSPKPFWIFNRFFKHVLVLSYLPSGLRCVVKMAASQWCYREAQIPIWFPWLSSSSKPYPSLHSVKPSSSVNYT